MDLIQRLGELSLLEILFGIGIAVVAIIAATVLFKRGRPARASHWISAIIAVPLYLIGLERGIALIVAVIGVVEFIHLMRRWRKRSPETEQRKPYLRRLAWTNLVMVACAVLVLFTWATLIATIAVCTAIVVALLMLFFYIWGDLDKNKTLCDKWWHRWYESKPRRLDYWKERKHTWILLPIIGITILAVINFGFAWQQPGTSPWLWLPAILTCVPVVFAVALHGREREKKYRWRLTCVIALLVCVPSLVAGGWMASTFAIDEADRIAAQTTAAETNPEEASEDLACADPLSAEIPNAAHDADDAISGNTEVLHAALLWQGLVDETMTADKLQEKGGGCPSEEGKRLLAELMEITTPEERGEFWRTYCVLQPGKCPVTDEPTN